MALAALITWNYALSDETGFLLQQSTNSGSTWTVNFPQPITTSYVDATVVPNGTYWYRIAATNRYGTGSWSNTGSVFVPPPTPDGPYNLVVVSGSAILTWESGSNYDDYYTIKRNGFSDFAVSLIETYTDTLVTSSYTGVMYDYQVAAINMSGTSSFSNTASITLQWSPNAPQNLTATSGSGFTALNWTESVGADSYYFEKSHNGISWFVWGSVGPTSYNPDTHISSSYTGNSYWYRLLARNSAGDSPWSNTASITFQWPPLAPINLVATSGSSQTILNWDSGSNGSDIFSFERSWDGGATWISFGSVASPPAQDNTGVSGSYTGNTYSYRCYAYNAAGNSPLSETASITYTFPPAPPTLDPVSSGSAILTWHSGSHGQQFYAIYKSAITSASFSNYVATNGSIETYTDTDVTASAGTGSTYYYKVAAINAYGTSSFSNTASITFTQGGGAPPSGSPDISGSISGSI